MSTEAFELIAAARRIAGEEAARAFGQFYAGQRILLPSGEFPLRPDHPMVSIMGQENARAVLKEVFVRTSYTILFPTGNFGAHAQLAKRIRDGLAGGQSANEVAQACGVTCRTVYNHRSKLVKAGKLSPVPKASKPAHGSRYRASMERHAASLEVVRRLLEDGRTVSETAAQLGMTWNTVNRCRSKLLKAGNIILTQLMEERREFVEAKRKDIADALARGLTVRQVARSLGLKTEVIYRHIARAKAKGVGASGLKSGRPHG